MADTQPEQRHALSVSVKQDGTTKSLPLLYPEQTTCLPQQILEKIYSSGDLNFRNDLLLIDIDDEERGTIISRMVEWAHHGDYTPFRSAFAPKVIERGTEDPRVAKRFNSTAHEHNVRYANALSTHNDFATELRIYKEAKDGGFQALQDHARSRISMYPIYSGEIRARLKILGRSGVESLPTDDPELAKFLREYLIRWKAELCKHDDTLRLLQSVIRNSKQFQAWMSSFEGEKELGKGITQLWELKEPEHAIGCLIEVLTNDLLAESKANQGRKNSENITPFIPEEPAKSPELCSAALAAAIEAASEKLILATHSGQGRLLVDVNGKEVPAPNTDFAFCEGDVLVIEGSTAATGPDLRVVTNSKGEVGQVLRTLFMRLVHHRGPSSSALRQRQENGAQSPSQQGSANKKRKT